MVSLETGECISFDKLCGNYGSINFVNKSTKNFEALFHMFMQISFTE